MDSVLQMMDYKLAQYNEKIEEPLKQFMSNTAKYLETQERNTKNVLDQMRVAVKEQVKLTFAEYQAVFEGRYNESIKKLKEYVERCVKTALSDIRKENEQRPEELKNNIRTDTEKVMGIVQKVEERLTANVSGM
eukprot:8648872-Lingulodinium_polyedra.AAC.1